VNVWVNRHVSFADDSVVYGRADHWASLAETAGRGRGDCEDYAIAKLQMLRAVGVSSRDLYLVIARDLVRRQDHALLAVRLNNQFVILDNGVDSLLPGDRMQDYRPILTFNENRAWTHGYRRPAQVTYASVGAAASAAGLR
jgi:predicted transglutaminase-like cysteine proteinase